MKPCMLRERLYVPEEYVKPEYLKQFTHIFEVKEQQRDESGRSIGLVSGLQEVRTYIQVPDAKGETYYGFSRGNIPFLKELFGMYPWIDKTVAPTFTSNLAFRTDRSLFTFAGEGVGQQEVVNEFLKVKNGVIKAAPRFGKTVCTVKILTEMKVKAIIVTHQEDLLSQFYAEFIDFSNLKNIQNNSGSKKDAKGRVVGFFSDYDNPEELDVCLLCWQTFASKYGAERIKKYRDTWGLLVVDECHRQGAAKYASVINNINARHRLGLTGTLKRVDSREKLVLDIIGPVVARGLVKQVPCAVLVTHTNLPVQFKPHEPLPFLFKRLYANEQRTAIVLKQIAEDVKDGMWICIGFHRSSKEQLQDFTDRLKALGYKAEAFYGGMKRNREEVLEEFRNGTVRIAVCNEAMLTGINIPRWNVYYSMFPVANVVFDKSGGTSELSGEFKQKFDRIRTPFRYSDKVIKRFGLIRDYSDVNGICQGMLKKRIKAYKSEKFPIEDIHITWKEKRL